MSNPSNGLERLRAANPVDENRVEGPESPRAQQLLARTLASPRPSQPRLIAKAKRLRRVVVLAAAALVTAAAALVWTRVIESPEAVLCYQAAHLDADIAAAPAGGTTTAQACAPVWEDGTLANPTVAPPGSIPPLTACVTDNGVLAVFPTADTTVCETLGLAHPDPAGQARADAIRRLQDQLIGYFQERACILLPEAETDVRRLLGQAGFTTWQIQTQPENPERPCASFSLDAAAETIHLVPIPRPGQ